MGEGAPERGLGRGVDAVATAAPTREYYIDLSVCLSVCLSIYRSIYLSIYLSINKYTHTHTHTHTHTYQLAVLAWGQTAASDPI